MILMKIEFFTSQSGRSPVTKFIDGLSLKDQSVILAVLADIQDHGFDARGVQFRQLQGKLWEIKIKTLGGGYRFLYVTLDKNLLFILHAFKKKTQKAPPKELKIAMKRLKEIL